MNGGDKTDAITVWIHDIQSHIHGGNAAVAHLCVLCVVCIHSFFLSLMSFPQGMGPLFFRLGFYEAHGSCFVQCISFDVDRNIWFQISF